jgi:osmotically-inducible protein OsmY
MRADSDIRHDVLQELDFDPKIGSRDIAVAVRDGVVTLAGFGMALGRSRRLRWTQGA